MKIIVLFGTDSGNAELVADDLTNELQRDYQVELSDLQDYDPGDISPESFYLVVCSTHGEGELPYSAIGFGERIERERPDLTGVRYAMFGMGDSYYQETYSQGSEIIDRIFTELGAIRVGEYGRHDASGAESASEVALAWLPAVLDAARLAPVGA